MHTELPVTTEPFREIDAYAAGAARAICEDYRRIEDAQRCCGADSCEAWECGNPDCGNDGLHDEEASAMQCVGEARVTKKLTPAEIAALSNAELNEYVAKLCGGADAHSDWYWWRGTIPDWPSGHPIIYVGPDFAESIDAQQAPGGPEEIARSRGWNWSVTCEDEHISFHGSNQGRVVRIDADKPESRLRLEALALALQEGS